jgi:hypothetical protein
MFGFNDTESTKNPKLEFRATFEDGSSEQFEAESFIEAFIYVCAAAATSQDPAYPEAAGIVALERID